MAAAYFLGRAGVPCTIFEREATLGGIVRHVIPSFRISDEAIDKDAALIAAYGAEICTNTEAPDVATLKKQGYTHILFAVGAWKAGVLDIPGHVEPVIRWMKNRKAGLDREPLGHVVVVGGGNTVLPSGRGQSLSPWSTAATSATCLQIPRNWSSPLQTACRSWS